MAKSISLSQKIWEAHLAGDTNKQIEKRLKVSAKTVYQAIYLKRRQNQGQTVTASTSTQEAPSEVALVQEDADDVREQAWERYKEAYVIKAITMARIEFDKWWGK